MAEILVIDDQSRTIDLCKRIMPEHDWHGPATSWEAARSEMRRIGRHLDMVLLDIHFDIPADALLGLPEGADDKAVTKTQRQQGVHILEALRAAAPDLPVVLMTARGDTVLETAADRHGAQEYTYFLDHEDIDARTLRAQVEGILKARRGTERDGPIFWGRSLPMRRIRQRLSTLARGRLPVILAGPTGTGKSLIARHFVHSRSRRKGKFVSVDLATLPADLVAAHLFGSVRGAYTGSVADRAGAFEEADTGTLFLDEIGNLPDDVQRMLLTVLQERVVTRLGSTTERKVDVKLVVATNEDLAQLVRSGRFRADLYMRLNPASTVEMPSLKERKLDFGRLVGFTVERMLEAGHIGGLFDEYRDVMSLEPGTATAVTGDQLPEAKPGVMVLLFPNRTMGALTGHSWPGNLREFAMVVENAIALSLAESIGAGPRKASEASARPDVVQVRPKLLRDQLRSIVLGEAADAGGGEELTIRIHPQPGLNKVAQDVERQYFTQLYLAHRGDFAALASVLLGDAEDARKVQLRFNQLGLKVRDLKARIP
jgi:DNA-binding NtrC family response regulator